MRLRFPLSIALLMSAGLLLFAGKLTPSQAQPRISSTPASVVLPTTAPTNTPQPRGNPIIEPSPSPTFTATQPLPDARLVSVAQSGTALVRDFPEDGTVLGVLVDNTEYQVLGQYFSWYQIQYAAAVDGRAWVYYLDVQVSGNFEEIPFIDPAAQPAQFSEQDLATATALALFQTPGFAETATAASRVLDIAETEANQGNVQSNVTPRFTAPAEIVPLQAPTLPGIQATDVTDVDFFDSTLDSVASGNIPPIFPIVGLLIFGTLGILIARIRN